MLSSESLNRVRTAREMLLAAVLFGKQLKRTLESIDNLDIYIRLVRAIFEYHERSGYRTVHSLLLEFLFFMSDVRRLHFKPEYIVRAMAYCKYCDMTVPLEASVGFVLVNGIRPDSEVLSPR